MPVISFEQVKRLIKDALQDPGFIGNNTIMQDGVTQDNVFQHTDAIRVETFVQLAEEHVSTVTGLVTQNSLDRRIDIAAGDPAPAENLINYQPINLIVPHSVVGYDYDGDLDGLEFEVRVRWQDTDPWRRILPRDAFTAPSMDPPTVDQAQVTLYVQIKVDTLVAPRVLDDIILFLEHL